MSLNVTGYPLEFDAIIHTDNLEVGTKTVKDNLTGIIDKAKEASSVIADFEHVTSIMAKMSAELAEMKAPGFLDGKTPERIQEINQYIAQQERLLANLTKTAAEYKSEMEKAAAIPVTPVAQKVPEKLDVGAYIGTQVLDQLKENFGEIDLTTQTFIKSLIALQIELNKLEGTQQNVTDAFNNGQITEKEYSDTQALIAGSIGKIVEQTNDLSESQKKYEQSLRSGTGSIEEKKVALQGLRDAYSNLSEAQKTSPEGEDMAKNIASLSQEIKGLDPSKINEAKSSVVSIRTELQQLTEQMARNPNSPMFGEWKKQAGELKESLKEVKTGIDQATNSTAGVEAFASGLRGLIGGFTAATGVIGLFTDDTAQVEEATKNAASALALLNGIQEVSNVLSKTSALNVYLLGLARKNAAVSTIAETGATEVNTVAAGVNVVATEAQTGATIQATVATKGLTAAMLNNPAALVIAAIAALAATILILRANNDKVTESQKAFNSTLKDFTKGMENATLKVDKVKEAFRLFESGLVSQKDALKVYNDTLGDSLGHVNSLANAEKKMAANAQVYIEIMGLKEQANAMFALSARLAAEQVENSNTDTLNWLQKLKASFTDGNLLKSQSDFTAANERNQNSLNSDLQKKIDALQQSGKYRMALAGQLAKNAAINANLLDLDEEKISKKKSGRNKKESDEQKEINDLIKTRASLLETIESLKQGSKDSGLTKDVTELEKINKKYDEAINKITEYNEQVNKLNQKSKTKVDKIDNEQIFKLDAARQTEIANVTAKQNLEIYKSQLSQEQAAFEAFENAKKEIGEQRAKELFASQIKGADSFMDYLKKQQVALQNTVSNSKDETAVKSAKLQLEANASEQQQEAARIAKADLDTQINNYKTLLQEVVSFNEQKAAINKKYDDLENTAKNDKGATASEIEGRLAAIKNMRAEDIKDLQNNLARQSDLYKLLGEDIVRFTKEEIKGRINLLDEILKTQKLTPETKAAVKSVVGQLKGLLDETNDSLNKTLDAADNFSAISSGLQQVGNSLKGVNDILAQTLSTLGTLSGAVSNTLKSIATLKSASATTGDKINAGFGIAGAFFSVVGTIQGLINAGAQKREELRKQDEASLVAVQKGEVAINDEYRKRALLQASINKLKIEGLKAEADALNKNSQSAIEDYNRILRLIQTQGKVATPEGFSAKDLDIINQLKSLGISNDFTKAFDAATSLSNKSFDELQKLFLEGRLDNKAKELFQTLQQLKDQGVDIDKALADNKAKADELFTGTTSSAILDSIVKGFADGKRATADFADNFEDLMRQSILNSFKYQALEKPIQDFYKDFAAASQSDGQLTQAEIQQLQQQYDQIIRNAGLQFDELTKLTKVDLTSGASGGGGNSLKGAIKGITETQAELLAGQFGGLRITAMTQLQVAQSSFVTLNKIENNTSRIAAVESYLRKFDNDGIKIR